MVEAHRLNAVTFSEPTTKKPQEAAKVCFAYLLVHCHLFRNLLLWEIKGQTGASWQKERQKNGYTFVCFHSDWLEWGIAAGRKSEKRYLINFLHSDWSEMGLRRKNVRKKVFN